MPDQIVYHYSFNQYPTLKTLEIQGLQQDTYADYTAYAKQVGDVGAYHQHISVFLEPVPDDIHTFYPLDHPVWAQNTELYQHKIVLSSAFPGKYKFTETPMHQKAARELPTHYSDADLLKFKQQLYRKQRVSNEIGDSYGKCRQKAIQLLGNVGLRKWYEALAHSPNRYESQYKYAANIPHLMLYPEDGEIPVQSSVKVVIGKTKGLGREEILHNLAEFCRRWNVAPLDVVIGSGAALVLYGGIRDTTSDIDVFLPSPVVDRIKRHLVHHTFTRPSGYTVDVWGDERTKVDVHYPDPGLAHLATQELEGYRAWTLEANLEFKLMLNRKKDQEDIRRLKKVIAERRK